MIFDVASMDVHDWIIHFQAHTHCSSICDANTLVNPRLSLSEKELILHQALRQAGVSFEYQFHLPLKSCGFNSETTRAFLDFAIPKPWGYILLECDEDQRRGYDSSCDVRRDFDMAASVALGSEHKLLEIRYNPDGYRVGGKTRVESKKDRMTRLLGLLEHEPVAFERIFLCYDQDEQATLPQVAASWDVLARQVSRLA